MSALNETGLPGPAGCYPWREYCFANAAATAGAAAVAVGDAQPFHDVKG